MTDQEIFDIAKEHFTYVSIESVRGFHEKSIVNLNVDGDYETGYFRQVRENKFIKCNERVDVSVVITKMNGDEPVEAVRLVHYHRAGIVYEITLYK